MKKILLTDCCELVMGQSPVSSSYNTEKRGLPFYQGNADFGKINPITRCWCDKPIKIAYKDDILISVRAPIGAINIASEECCIGRGLAAVRALKGKCLYEFLYYALQSNTEELKSQGTGSTFKAISKQILANSELPDITLEEQHRIVNRLLKVDTLIENANEQLRLFDQLVKSRFLELFGDLKLNDKKWEVKFFKDLTLLITDGEHSTPRRTDNGIYLLSARNVLNHSLQLNDIDYIDEVEYERISKRIQPMIGDVLLSCSGSVGRCCAITKDIKFQMVRSVALLRFKAEINPVFAEYMIVSDYLQEQINSNKTASSQSNLFQGKIKMLKGVIPPLDLQNQFADFVEEVNKSKLEVQKSLEELETLKKSLMQQYFG